MNVDLHRACRMGDLAAIEAALVNNPDGVNAVDTHTGWSVLYTAVICRHVKVVKTLLELGADPNQQSKVGEYPIHQAAESNQAAVTELLLRKGADPDVQQSCNCHLDGETALHIAAAKNFAEIIQVLLRYEADPSVKDWVYGRTALHTAVVNNSVESALSLLQHGALTTSPDSVIST